ncbi:uncharacterized protein LOC122523320 [Polistes fuscatus]|uniref:uncharacterized protein LOC122523320 n=1 Tax=Polistes fuscatus TaxID=30207 RepID=UPI001CAA3397|nr:uncharacterized protein LOC122523320 [Polistes fuscatus]
MIAGTYDCGCIPPKITRPYSNCLKSHSHDQTQQKYTLLRCHAVSTPSSPRNSCCKPLKQNSVTCRNAISSCPNFDKIHNCTCSPEPPKLVEISQIPDDCKCGLKKLEDCKEERSDPCPTEKKSKIISDISKKRFPYKEIEAIINDNHMVIRMQKEPVQEEFEPPCDCPNGPGILPSKSDNEIKSLGSPKCRNDIVYEMSDLSKPGYKCTGQNSMIKQSCDQSGKGGRTITVYPHPGILQKVSDNIQDDKEKKKHEKDKTIKHQIDLEENPNIFVLRIRKMSRNVDGKHKLNLEFRAPRPWINRTLNEPIKRPNIQLQMNPENERKDDTTVKKKSQRTGEKKKISKKEKK